MESKGKEVYLSELLQLELFQSSNQGSQATVLSPTPNIFRLSKNINISLI